MIAFEVFAAKANDGRVSNAFLSVPARCGLKGADTLTLRGLQLTAYRGRTVMALDFPALDEASGETLRHVAASQGRVAIGEFNAAGIVDAYMLRVEAID